MYSLFSLIFWSLHFFIFLFFDRMNLNMSYSVYMTDLNSEFKDNNDWSILETKHYYLQS